MPPLLLLLIIITGGAAAAPRRWRAPSQVSSSPSPSTPAASHGCTGELLYNGICLPPGRWPPRINLTSSVRTPHYLLHPPSIIEIDVGRQLFIDDWLIDPTASTGGLQRYWGQAVWHPLNPVLRPTEPWEKGWARPRPGGLFWEPELRLFRCWYQCGWACSARNPGSVGDCNNVCIATSTDGVRWTKPKLVHGPRPGTNIVLTDYVDTATVWRDDAPTTASSERYKLAVVPTNGTISEMPSGHNFLRLYTSPDGVFWSRRVNKTGLTEDGTSLFYNPFRERWVFSIKAPSVFSQEFNGWTEGPLDRHRMYHESTTAALLGSGSQWQPEDLLPWLAADVLDPPWLGDTARSRKHASGTLPGLYLFDATAYESLMVGMMPIFRCKSGYPGCPKTHPEFDSVHLAFSRDGFFFSRPPVHTAPLTSGVRLDTKHRTPFLPMDPLQRPSSWNYGCVLNTGGPAIVNDTLYFFVSGSTGSVLDSSGSHNWTQSMGLATLRRDGFAAMTVAESDGGSVDQPHAPTTAQQLVTRPIRFSGKHLFVNVESLSPLSRLRVAVLDPETKQPALGYALTDCRALVGANSTKIEVAWRGRESQRSLLPASSQAPAAARLLFELSPGLRLFSFWVAKSAAAHSNGYVGRGGPAFRGLRDTEEVAV
jgi:hypothetical protein